MQQALQGPFLHLLSVYMCCISRFLIRSALDTYRTSRVGACGRNLRPPPRGCTSELIRPPPLLLSAEGVRDSTDSITLLCRPLEAPPRARAAVTTQRGALPAAA